ARALAAAQEGTAKVLARQAAEAEAAAARAKVGGNGTKGAATARRGSRPVAEAPVTLDKPTPSGTGPELAVKGLEAPRQAGEQLSYSAPGLDASPKDGGRAKAAKAATVTGTKETPRNAP